MSELVAPVSQAEGAEEVGVMARSVPHRGQVVPVDSAAVLGSLELAEVALGVQFDPMEVLVPMVME